MRWSLDARANAMYVHLREGTVARTVETASGAADLDDEGQVLGIEVLSVHLDARSLADELSLGDDDIRSLAFLQAGLSNVLRLSSHVVASEPEAAPAIETAQPYVLQECPA